mgnify:CR=1 FL=1
MEDRLRGDHYLRNREQTDQCGNKVYARLECLRSESEAGISRQRIGTDTGDHQSQSTGSQTFYDIVSGYAGNDSQTENSDEKVLCGAELQRQKGQGRRDGEQRNGAEHTADHGAVGTESHSF